ncbi:rod shape-determining protein MreD [Sphingorhabdus arenilitoris]|uniref:Rod shape-determining protein MreD n=1 Tax=Sphingorhabdus arenilitoris TaxID=1490041 RepID=A0ABV8RFX4_9SPHN
MKRADNRLKKRPISRLTKSPIAAFKRPGRTYESRLYREQSRLSMIAIPIASVLLGSMVTAMPIIESQPILPPFGLMIFLAWRLLRPGLWPMWAGLPFGMFDDIFSGQPFGSAALIWSLIMITLEIIDIRAVWRDHLQDWLIASFMMVLALFGGLLCAGLVFKARPDAIVLLPQILLCLLLYPLIVRIVARLDRWRLST